MKLAVAELRVLRDPIGVPQCSSKGCHGSAGVCVPKSDPWHPELRSLRVPMVSAMAERSLQAPKVLVMVEPRLLLVQQLSAAVERSLSVVIWISSSRTKVIVGLERIRGGPSDRHGFGRDPR